MGVSGACSCTDDDFGGTLGSQCTCTATSDGTAHVCASTFSSSAASWDYTVKQDVYSGSGSDGQSGANCLSTYQFPVTTGMTYTVSTTGSFTGDTYLRVSGPCTCADDDYGGTLGSQCTCTATSYGLATLCASSHAGSAASWNYTISETSVLPVLQPTWSYSNDVLSGWPHTNVIDGDPATSYSSNYFATSANDRNAYIEAGFYVPTRVHSVVLTARHGNGFPLHADVYISNPTYTGWIYKGNYPQEGALLQSDDTLTINLGASTTNAVLVVPTMLGVDTYGSHYLQMAEISFR